ncbi:MAG: hypothetical protein II767_05080 [Proteobacteria bacterium]|nr:hypothetical protein [Pseudomonadota bacterium]
MIHQTPKIAALLLSSLIYIAACSAGCAKKPPVKQTAEPQATAEPPEIANFDVYTKLDVEALMKILKNRDPQQRVMPEELVQSIMKQYGPEIEHTAYQDNEIYEQCLSTINPVVQDGSECESDALDLLNTLIEEYARIEYLKTHNQKDIQRSLWRVLLETRYYSSNIDYSEDDTNKSNEIRKLIDAGADLNAPNWHGEIAAFAIDDDQLILEQLKSGAIQYDIKDKNGNCLLHKFASNEDILDFLVQAGLDLNTQNNKGQTPLFNVKNPKIIEKYIKAGAQINHEDHLGNTPIFQAAKNDTEHFPLTAQLVKHGADINHANHAGQTPVYEINIENGLQDFINLGAKLSVQDNEANTPLHTYDITKDDENLNNLDIYLKNGIDIKSAGNLPLLKLCLNDEELNRLCIEKLTKAGADITAKNREGLGFLSYLLKNRIHMDSSAYDYARNELKLKYDKIPNLINVISEMRFDYDAEEETDEFSATMTDLSDTLEYAETALKDMLTDGVLDVNERMPTGETLLFYVINHSTAEALIKAGADIHAKNTSGQTALWRGNIYALLDAGADAKVVDNKGESPLFARYKYYIGTDWGTVNGFNIAEIRRLLDAGANINATDPQGRSLIYHVLSDCDGIGEQECHDTNDEGLINEYCTSLSAIQFFAKRGANLNIKDNDGITPLMHVCDMKESDTEEFVSELIKAGADVNAKDNAGKSVADHCAEHNNSALQEILKNAGAK